MSMDTQILLSICQIIAVAVIPLFIWWVGNRQMRKKEKIEAKRELFFTLMKRRKAHYVTQETADALNLIDVVFQEDEKVRDAWKSYLSTLNPISPENQNSNAYLLDLLSEMAQTLGYEKLKQTEIDRFYQPQGLVDSKNNEQQVMVEAIKTMQFITGQTEKPEATDVSAVGNGQ